MITAERAESPPDSRGPIYNDSTARNGMVFKSTEIITFRTINLVLEILDEKDSSSHFMIVTQE